MKAANSGMVIPLEIDASTIEMLASELDVVNANPKMNEFIERVLKATDKFASKAFNASVDILQKNPFSLWRQDKNRTKGVNK